jgi:hypothetical protein
MGTLMFVCPATGIEVSTQVEMDRETLATADKRTKWPESSVGYSFIPLSAVTRKQPNEKPRKRRG